MTRVSLLQLNSGEDRARNLDQIRQGLDEAHALRSELVLLPEACSYRGAFRADMVECEQDAPTVELVAQFARSTGTRVLIGGLWLSTEDPQRPANCCLLIDRDGTIAATYRKIHMFQLHAAGQADVNEAAFTTAGDELVTVDCGDVVLGLSICYDLRFPDMYQALSRAGATVLCVPANFTLHTGRDHWEVLLRARAIENLAYVLAPAQIGPDGEGGRSYGRTMIVDPWGTVMCTAHDEATVITADLDLERVRRCRSTLPALDDRRPELYRHPVRQAATGA